MPDEEIELRWPGKAKLTFVFAEDGECAVHWEAGMEYRVGLDRIVFYLEAVKAAMVKRHSDGMRNVWGLG